jgi:hypothetical protein
VTHTDKPQLCPGMSLQMVTSGHPSDAYPARRTERFEKAVAMGVLDKLDNADRGIG